MRSPALPAEVPVVFSRRPLVRAIEHLLHTNHVRGLSTAVLCLGLGLGGAADAATFTVTNTNDAGPGSLRQAIVDADANPGADEIVFASGVSGTISLTSGELEINDPVSVAGPGPDVVQIDGNGGDVFFPIFAALEISGLKISNASSAVYAVAISEPVTARNVAIVDNFAGFSNPYGGPVLIEDSTISGNEVGIGGSNTRYDNRWTIINSTISGNGIGIRAAKDYRSITSVDVQRSTISGNDVGLLLRGNPRVVLQDSLVSDHTGAGLANEYLYRGLELEVRTTTIAGNLGGGLDFACPYSPYYFPTARDFNVVIDSSTLSDNTGVGGVAVDAAAYCGVDLTVRNSTISGNAASIGGGMRVTADADPATQYFDKTLSIVVEHSTITANDADQGGGVALITDEPSAQVSLRNVLIADNVASVADADLSGAFVADYSLIGDPGTASVTEGVPGSNLFGVAPMLGALQDNGGPTLTHALLPGSPAVDRGDPDFVAPPDFDQRGTPYVRVANGRIDIGAFEVQDDDLAPVGAGRVRCIGDIDGDKVADMAVVLRDGQAQVKDLNGSLLTQFRFEGLGELVDVEVLPDIDGNGAPELAGLGKTRAEVRDTLTGALLGVAEFDPAVGAVDLEWTQDYDGNGVPELARLGLGSALVEVSDAITGNPLGSVDFSSYIQPRDLEIQTDLNGNGADELALLGDNVDLLKHDKVEIRDSATGVKLKDIWLGAGWQVLQHELLTDHTGNGFAEVAVLRVENDSDRVQVLLRDTGTGRRLGVIGFDRNYPPQRLLRIDSVNRNGSDEVVVFGQRFNGGNQKAQVKDSKTGKLIKAVFFNKAFAGQDIATCADINGNGAEELILLGQRADDGALKVFIKDAKTGALIGRVGF